MTAAYRLVAEGDHVAGSGPAGADRVYEAGDEQVRTIRFIMM